MNTPELGDDVVVLAGSEEVRIVGSTAEAEQVVASGFLPAVVLVGQGLRGPGAAELARRLGADPARGAIPVLTVSDDAGRIHLTSVNEGATSHSAPEELGCILQVLDEICTAAAFPPPGADHPGFIPAGPAISRS